MAGNIEITPEYEPKRCPCCNQMVKLYKRKLTSSMVYGLILLKDTNTWVHLEDFLKNKDIPSSIRGDITKLKYWKLIEKCSLTRNDGSNRNGFYRITDKGRQFVRGTLVVPSHINLYNNKFYGYAGELIDIKYALGNKFSYDELMKEK